MHDWPELFRGTLNSGVYRMDRDGGARDVGQAAAASGLDFVRVDLSSVDGKSGLLSEVARALGFPAYFGMNWDALSDCLTDMSFRPAIGWVLLLMGLDSLRGVMGTDVDIAVRVLGVAAEHWKQRSVPFYVILAE